MAKPVPNPVSAQQAALFDHYVRKWQVLLNLADWRIERVPGKTTALAEVVSCDTPNRLAKYRIGGDWAHHDIDARLERTAAHEVLHVFFHVLTETAIEAGEYTDAVLAAEHACIIVLETLFGPLYDTPKRRK